MDPEPLSKSTTPIDSPKHESTAQSPIRDETSTKPEELNSFSSDAISSPVSDITLESIYRSLSPTQSPSLQVMERPEDISNRCSSSSSSSSEWSSVSNESLFSIHITNSYTHDQGHLLAVDAFNSGDLMSFSDVDLKAETPSELDDYGSKLDEPQKVVRWKTQVERHADEEKPSQDHQWESSPLTNQNSSEFGDQVTPKPKKKFCWSLCDCGSCNMPNWKCWNDCWRTMSCSNCKPKKVCSSHS